MRLRFKVSTATVVIIGTIGGLLAAWRWYFSVAEIPKWVLQTGFSERSLRNWPALAAVAIATFSPFAGLAFYYLRGSLKTPPGPPPPAKQYPFEPSVSTRELFKREDAATRGGS